MAKRKNRGAASDPRVNSILDEAREAGGDAYLTTDRNDEIAGLREEFEIAVGKRLGHANQGDDDAENFSREIIAARRIRDANLEANQREDDARRAKTDEMKERNSNHFATQSEGRLRSLMDRDPERYEMFMRAAGGDAVKANELLMQQLRKERGLDRETRGAQKMDQRRALAARSILRRNAGNPEQLQRALSNFNRNNPQNPMRPEDLGLSGATDPTTARPGEVVRVPSGRNVNPNNIATGAILDTNAGMRRVDQVGDKKIEVPVQQDSATGKFFPDPDRYDTQEAFDGKIRRQDRINLRESLLRSGDSVMANSQRRLDAAREAAASSIPEIREAGLKKVAEEERNLHWRYISEKASLGVTDPGMVGEERVLNPDPAKEGPSMLDLQRDADRITKDMVSEYRRQGVTIDAGRMAEVQQAAMAEARRRSAMAEIPVDGEMPTSTQFPQYDPDPEIMETPKGPKPFTVEDQRKLREQIEDQLLEQWHADQNAGLSPFDIEMRDVDGGPPVPSAADLERISDLAHQMAKERLAGSRIPLDPQPGASQSTAAPTPAPAPTPDPAAAPTTPATAQPPLSREQQIVNNAFQMNNGFKERLKVILDPFQTEMGTYDRYELFINSFNDHIKALGEADVPADRGTPVREDLERMKLQVEINKFPGIERRQSL